MSIKSKSKKLIDRMSSVYYDSTLMGVLVSAIIILALIALFYFLGEKLIPGIKDEFGKYFKEALDGLIPLFIVVVCLELFFIRRTILPDVRIIKDSIENQFSFKAFNTKKDFESYFEKRLKSARQIRVTHMSSEDDLLEGNKKNYLNLIEKFVKEGNSFERLLCTTDNEKIREWCKNELEKYKKYKYDLYYIDKVKVEKMKLLNVMIIDDDEVCMGGGYKRPGEDYTISINNPKIVKFFSDYFHELSVESTRLTFENIDNLMQEPLTLLTKYDEIYKISEEIVKKSEGKICVTGFTPNEGHKRKDFRKAVSDKLIEKKDLEFRSVVTIRKEKDIEDERTEYEEYYKDCKCLIKAVLDDLFHLDVLISDNKEMLIGIPSQEAFKGFSDCVWIKNKPETEKTVRNVAEWYNLHVWNKGIEIIGNDGINEENIKKIKEQLAKKEQEKKE